MTTSGDTNKKDAANTENSGENRRVNAHLRVVFENACRITAPFFDPDQIWGEVPWTLYARQTLCEAYHDLTQQDIALLLSALQRFHRK